MIAQMSVQIILALIYILIYIISIKKKVRMLELVDSANLSFADISRERSSRSSDKYLNDSSFLNKTNQIKSKLRTI